MTRNGFRLAATAYTVNALGSGVSIAAVPLRPWALPALMQALALDAGHCGNLTEFLCAVLAHQGIHAGFIDLCEAPTFYSGPPPERSIGETRAALPPPFGHGVEHRVHRSAPGNPGLLVRGGGRSLANVGAGSGCMAHRAGAVGRAGYVGHQGATREVAARVEMVGLFMITVVPETRRVVVDMFLSDVGRRTGAAFRVAQEQAKFACVRLGPAVNIENVPGQLGGRRRDKILLITGGRPAGLGDSGGGASGDCGITHGDAHGGLSVGIDTENIDANAGRQVGPGQI